MHFLGQMLSRESKVPLTHVAYKGGSAALADTIGGTIPALISTLPNLLPMHRAGKLRILATSGAEPDPAVPGVPTFQSAGFPALTIEESFGYFARSGTPAAAIATLSQAIIRAVHSPHVLGLLKKSEFHVQTLSPDALDREVRTEFVMWDRIVKSTGYTPEQ
jgi:tripartite-type tricarboxylate transporter receptor subunit TctC